MPDQDTNAAIQRLADRVGGVETEIRVVKHDLSNMQLGSRALNDKLEKIEERVGAKFDHLSSEIATKFQTLSSEIAAINVKHERGVGFFAGVGFIFTTGGALLLALAKFLFGGAP